MDFATFKASLSGDAPPAGAGGALQALWRVSKGEWDPAHALAQAEDDTTGAWVHAHVHRVEGDARNAGYWYRRAGKPPAECPLDQEWDEIAAALTD
jgi:hypothetical protein